MSPPKKTKSMSDFLAYGGLLHRITSCRRQSANSRTTVNCDRPGKNQRTTVTVTLPDST